jgi:hypothetical protein
MDIVVDLNPIYQFLALPADILLYRFLLLFGWLPISIVMLYGFKEIWLDYIRTKWSGMQKYTFLAIDIPRGNEQSPKAVENLFSYLAGAHGTINLIENYWEGKVQLAFSLEIVSIEGYTQFLIRTPVPAKELVESAVYAQYPDAEVIEVDDYAKGMPTNFPDDEYDVWGAEFIQVKPSAYPIKTYEEFEHQMGDPKVTYRDPMAALMDLTSSLKKGEQLWYQIIIVPIGFEWPEIGDEETRKILKEKSKSGKHLGDKIIDLILKTLENFSETVYSLWGDIEDKKKDEKDDSLKMMQLKPKEKRQVESIHKKTSKIGFEFKIRMVYIAKKDVMNKPKVVNGFVGYMKQFAAMDLNNLKPDMDVTATRANYFFKEMRVNLKKNKIVKNYVKRDKTAGRTRGILNTEELATIWHFPVESAVKAPMIQKAARKKAEPPMSLPTEERSGLRETVFREDIFGGDNYNNHNKIIEKIAVTPSFLKNETQKEESKKEIFNKEEEEKLRTGEPPSNLPVV